eukprot:TRINITY_DN1305_c0_g1_i8.p1 TRINITY_DN1305_c0_g1~~TRINITY_DN1305_c0_g1_i8.p1  ORF type:complete len:379 (-),score=76.79 TRINITY_DN1305_c0_g1_i8:339-1475(-)
MFLRTVFPILQLCSFNIRAEPSIESRIEGAFFGSLISDALSLGSHYEYDAAVIKKAYAGTISEYMAPGEKMGGSTHGIGWGRRQYHPGQKKGDQTDYGEYTILMLEYLTKYHKDSTHRVDLQQLLPVWRKRIEKGWGAWICTQSRQALQMVQQGITDPTRLGGHSNAMSLRSAAAFAVWKDEDDLIDASRKMMFTHRNDEALGGGEFFMRVTWKIIYKGMTPREAIEASGKEMNKWFQRQVEKGISKYEEAMDPARPLGKQEFCDDLAMTSMAKLWDVGKSEPIKVGKASPTEGTMPSSIYIILKYVDDFEAGVKANAMVGGDNAARAVAIGMVLGAYHGVEAFPPTLVKTLNAWKKNEKLLKKLPLLKNHGKNSQEL